MPKRKAPELTPAEQKKRFEALAREVGAKQEPDDFKKALEQIAKADNASRRKKSGR